MKEKKTVILRNVPGKAIVVLEKPGLPSPIPIIGDEVFIPEIGNTVCTGAELSMGKEVIEIQLTIR